MEKAAVERDGSDLCLSCGMCCRGMLHGWVALRNGEIDSAGELGLTVVESPYGPAFALPCARLSGNACEIYDRRPADCAGYQCGLLGRYLDGSIALEEARAVVADAKRLAAEVTTRIGDEDFPDLRNRWRNGLSSFLSGNPATVAVEQAAFLHLSALCDFLDRNVASESEQHMVKKQA